MNPFEVASNMGFSPKNIISFLKKTNPKYEQYFSQALLAGYTSEQAFDFITKVMGGKKVDPKIEKRVFGGVNESNLVRQTNYRDKDRKDHISPLIGGTVGAIAGGLSGGPLGAAIGGVTGYKELQKLSKAYEDHVQRGGKLPFGEFVKSIVKAGSVAGIAGGQVEPLKQAAMHYLSTLGKAQGEEQPPETESPDQGGASPVVGGETIDAEVTPVPEQQPQTPAEPPRDIEASYEIFKKMGVSPIIDAISDQVEGFDGYKALKKLYGKDFIKDLERQYKRPAEEIISEALEYSKQKKGSVKEEETVDEVAEQQEVSPEEAEKRAEKLSSEDHKMGQYMKLFKQRADTGEQGKTLSKKPKPLSNALKSSNVRGAFYDADENKMRVIFAPKKGSSDPGAVYTYDNIDKDTFNKMVSGEAKPVTEGENKFGVWFNQKDPSIGATFSKEIKKNPEKFPYEKVGAKDYTLEEKQISEADRTFLVSELFEPFAEMRKKGRQITKASELKKIMPALKQVDEDFISDMIGYIEEKLKLKNPVKMKRLQKEITKEFL